MQCPIAIVGISAELPSGEYSEDNLDYHSFYDFLINKGQSYERIPSDRFNISAWKGTARGQVLPDSASFIKGIDKFDNLEFGVSAKDARAMSPATRKLLEQSFLALLDSGIEYRGRNVGCYTSGVTYTIFDVSEPDVFDAEGSSAGYPSMVANRVSYHLNLRGPSIPTDTACCSSLAALHLAIQGLQSGDCEAAVVAGSQMNHRFFDFIQYSQAGILSPDGKCKPFDAQADGFARSEGTVAIVVKPLSAAIADNDRVYATILGSSINSSGSDLPPAAPNPDAQSSAMKVAFAKANRKPQDVDYVELHGTGTARGDPTEANWVGKEFSRESDLIIGSVKGNIGHMEICAFLASLCKVCAILEHGIIPPNVNLRSPNPSIQWEKYRLRVPLSPTELVPRLERPLMSIASSGIGGVNGHAVIEGAPRQTYKGTRTATDHVLFMVGGLTPTSAADISNDIQDFIRKQEESSLPVVSTMLGRRVKQMTWRSLAVYNHNEGRLLKFSVPQMIPRKSPPIVFVFSGQGPQYLRMGNELFKSFPSFKNNILELDQIFIENTKTSLIRDYGLFDESQRSTNMSHVLGGQWPISVTLPALTILQIAIFDLLSELGLRPDIILGHSAGETAVLYASGAGSKTLAVQLAIARGNAFATMENSNASMAALGVGPDKALDILMKSSAGLGKDLAEIACYNAPDAVALSGSVCSLARVEEVAVKEKVFYRRLRTAIPVHSSLLEQCKDAYEDSVRNVFAQHPGDHAPSIATYSTLTGERFCGSYDAEYFWENSRKPVQFVRAIKAISERSDTPPVFIEISPHPVLAGYISSISPSARALPVAERPGKDGPPREVRRLLTTLGEITVAGCNSVDFASLNGAGCFEKNIVLPAYPFSRKQFPLYPDTDAVSRQFIRPNGPLNRKSLRIGRGTHLSLEQHIIRGEPIMPAAGFLEMAIEFGKTCLYNVKFNSMLSLSRGNPVEVTVELIESKWTAKSLSNSRASQTLGSPSFLVHAEGIATSEQPEERDFPVDLLSYTKNHQCLHGSDLYSSLEYFAQYGPQYKRVEKLYIGDNDAVAFIRGHTDHLNTGESADYSIHPAILDSAFHATIHENFTGNLDQNTYYLPSGVGHMTWYGKKTSLLMENFCAYIKLSHWSPDVIEYDITLSSGSGQLVCFLESFSVSRNTIHPVPHIQRRFDLIYQPTVFPMRINNVSSIRKPLDELSTKSADLFVTLDSLETPSPEFTQKHHKWRAYLNRLESKLTLSDKMPSKSLVPQDDLVLILSQLLTCIVRQTEIQVLRVLSISPRHQIFEAILATFEKFPSVFFEYFCDEDPNTTAIKAGTNYSTRMCGRLDLSSTDVEGASGIAEESIDIIISVDAYQAQKESHEDYISSLSRLLVATGTLISKEHHDCSFHSNLPGAKWYHSHTYTYDSVSNRCSHPSIHEWISGFKHQGLSTCGFYHKSQHPFFFLACHQKHNRLPVECRESSSHNEVFHYFFNDGKEEHLQFALKQYDTNTQLTIILTAIEGLDSASAYGFTQALRQEVPAWDILLVIVHPSLSDLPPFDIQESIMPLSHYQKQFYIGECGEIMVPRIALFRPDDHAISSPSRDIPSSGDIYFEFGSFRSFLTVSKSGMNMDEVFSIGLSIPDHVSAAHEAVYSTTELSQEEAIAAAKVAPSVAISVLAIGIHFLSASLRELKILVTNADTFVGEVVAKIYKFLNYHVITVTSDESSKSLWALRKERFDFIVSGYDDPDKIQVLEAVLGSRASGKLFLWNHRDNGVAHLIHEDPVTVKDALCHGFVRLREHLKDLLRDSSAIVEIPPALSHSSHISGLQFYPDKTYFLVGGIGSLGSNVALWMYQRGARNIILTSRSGQNSLRRTENFQAIKIINFLKERKDLVIRLEAVDATDKEGMKSLFETLRGTGVGGCILLSTVVEDASFMTQNREAYASAHSAKRGALQTLSAVIDISSLDFLVAFSSVSGMFGIPGQTSYASANSALDYLISAYPNACSMIAPAILNTRLMDGGLNAGKRTRRLRGIREWGFTVDRLLACLEDCIVLLQSGKRTKCYIPDLDWSKMNESLTLTSLTSHLVPQTHTTHSTDSLTTSTMQISRIICDALAVKAEDIDPSIPLTSYGLDSISAAKLSFELVPFIQISQIQLLADLSLNHILERVSKKDLEQTNTDQEDISRKVQRMHDLVERYSIRYDGINHPSSSAEHNGLISQSECVVIITGTTGALGAHILAELLHNSSVDRIYAFNRVRKDKSTICSVQEDAFVFRGLPTTLLLDERLVLVECDFEKDDFGIDSCLYKTLLSTVTHIVLNAWLVDFVVPLESYESQIATVRTFGTFALSQLRSPAKIIFISTIGVYRHPKDTELIPHGPILDASIAIGAGYLESKWVAERILQNAAEDGILDTLVIRVGQLSGGKSGYWKTSEWVPSLVKSSLKLGCLPDGNDTIAWLSLDGAAKVIVQCRNAPAGTLNIAHPKPITWSSIFGPLSLRLRLSLVPYEEWLLLLEKVISEQKDVRLTNDLPALPLVEFFRGRKRAEDDSRKTKDTLGLLPKVSTGNIPIQFERWEEFALDQLTAEDADRWVDYWVKIGFLPSV